MIWFEASKTLHAFCFTSVVNTIAAMVATRQNIWAISRSGFESDAELKFTQNPPKATKTSDDFEKQWRTILRNKLVKLIGGAMHRPYLTNVLEGTLDHLIKKAEEKPSGAMNLQGLG